MKAKVLVSCTVADLADIDARAYAAGLSRSAYLTREALNGDRPRSAEAQLRDATDAVNEITATLKRLNGANDRAVSGRSRSRVLAAKYTPAGTPTAPQAASNGSRGVSASQRTNHER